MAPSSLPVLLQDAALRGPLTGFALPSCPCLFRIGRGRLLPSFTTTSLYSAWVSQVPTPIRPFASPSAMLFSKHRWQHAVRPVFPIHRLDVIGRRGHDLGGIEPDQIRRPLHESIAGQQRRVTGHRHHVRIAQQSGHERGLAHGGVERARPVLAVRGEFPGENLGSLAVIGVVAGGLFEKPIRAGGSSVRPRSRPACRCGTCPRRSCQLPSSTPGPEVVISVISGMLVLERLVKHLIALEVLRSPLFVADSEVFQTEGCRMAHFRAEFPPLAW